jgi:hypothetical protein
MSEVVRVRKVPRLVLQRGVIGLSLLVARETLM